MKHHFLAVSSLLFCITCSVEANAQQSPVLHLGIKAGANMIKVSSESNGLNGKYGLGYQAGIMTRVDLGRMYVQGEALLNKRKTSYNLRDENSPTMKWNSIDIPVVAGYKIINDKDFNFRVFAGGVYSYAFNDNISTSQALQDGFKKFDKSNIGITGGIGVDYKNFSLDLRYEKGLSNISKEFKSKPQNISLSIGYFLF